MDFAVHNRSVCRAMEQLTFLESCRFAALASWSPETHSGLAAVQVHALLIKKHALLVARGTVELPSKVLT